MLTWFLAVVVTMQGAFVPQPMVQIDYVTGGQPVHLLSIEADPTHVGSEVLVYLPGAWIVSIGRWHPTKRGVGGSILGPGLCVEPWTLITVAGPVWHYVSVLDGDGDGREEFLVWTDDGRVFPYTSTGLHACR